jgi:citrate synthase
VPRFPTSLGASDPDTITLLGQNLAADLMGKVGFGELALWLVTQRRPTPSQVRVFEAVLVALADHGFTPTAIAARLTYLSAPDSVQGALAAGLLGGGSRFLGVTEDAGRFLSEHARRAGQPLPADDAGWDALALAAVTRARASASSSPASAIPCTRSPIPAPPALIAIADEEGLRGPHLRLFEAIGRVHPQVLGRTLPLNGAGTCGAALADLGLPPDLLRGFALLAAHRRAAGPAGRGTAPPGRHGRLPHGRAQHRIPATRLWRKHLREPPWPPSQRSSHRRTTRSTTGPAPPPARTGRRSPTNGSPRSRRSARHSPAPAPMSWSWSAPTTSTSCGSTTCRSSWSARRRSTTRTSTTRSGSSACPRMFVRGDEELSGYLLRQGMDAGFDLAFSNELRIDHSITCPLITLRPEADLPIVPIYTNIFAPPLPQPRRFVELGRPSGSWSSPGRATSGWPSSAPVTCRSSWAGRASSARTAPIPSSTARRSAGSPRVTWNPALAEVSLESLWLPGNATHGFMDFMLMMGVAGENVKADYVDSLDLFHTMEAYFTWYPEASAMSKYLLNKFLYTVDRDPELVERYRADPRGTVAWWEDDRANLILNCPAGRAQHLADVHGRRAGGAGGSRLRQAVRARGAQFPDPDPVHRHVRAGLRRAAGFPARVREEAEPLQPALPRHLHLSGGAVAGFAR